MTKEVTLIQTGGLPDGEIIVSIENGHPKVFAFITDVELDVFTVVFESDGIFDIVEGEYPTIKIHSGILSEIGALAVLAEPIVDEIDERYGAWQEGGEKPDFTDLLTNHERVEIEEGLAEKLSSTLGVVAIPSQGKLH